MAIDTESRGPSSDGSTNVGRMVVRTTRRVHEGQTSARYKRQAQENDSLRETSDMLQSSIQSSREEDIYTAASFQVEKSSQLAMETSTMTESQLETTVNVSTSTQNTQQLAALEDQVVGLVSMLRIEREQKESLAQQLDDTLHRIEQLKADNDRLSKEFASSIDDFDIMLQNSKKILSQKIRTLEEAAQELVDRAQKAEKESVDAREETTKIEQEFTVAFEAHEKLKADFEEEMKAVEEQKECAEISRLNLETQLEKSRIEVEEKTGLISTLEAECVALVFSKDTQVQQHDVVREFEEVQAKLEEKTAALAKVESERQSLAAQARRLGDTFMEKDCGYEARQTELPYDSGKAETTAILLRKANEEKDSQLQNLENKLDELRRAHQRQVENLDFEIATQLETINGLQVALSSVRPSGIEDQYDQSRNDLLDEITGIRRDNISKDNTIKALQSEARIMDKAKHEGTAKIKSLEQQVKELGRASQLKVTELEKIQVKELEKTKAHYEDLVESLLEEQTISDFVEAVVICIDVSSSMFSWFDKAKIAYEQLIAGIIARNPATHVGLLSHGDDSGHVINLEALIPVGTAAARFVGRLDRVTVAGSTEYYQQVLETAQGMLVEFHTKNSGAHLRIITIGDGGIETDSVSFLSYVSFGSRRAAPYGEHRFDTRIGLGEGNIPVHAIIVNPSFIATEGGVPGISSDTDGKCFILKGWNDSETLKADELVGRPPAIQNKKCPPRSASSRDSSFGSSPPPFPAKANSIFGKRVRKVSPY